MHKIIQPDGKTISPLLQQQLEARRAGRAPERSNPQANIMLREAGSVRVADLSSQEDRRRLFEEHGVSVVLPVDDAAKDEQAAAPPNVLRGTQRLGFRVPTDGSFRAAPMRLPPQAMEEDGWNYADASIRVQDYLRLYAPYVTPTPPMAALVARPGVEAWQMTTDRLISRLTQAMRMLTVGYPVPTPDERLQALESLPDPESGEAPAPVAVAPHREPVQTAEAAEALSAAGVRLEGDGPWEREATADDLEAWTAAWMASNRQLGPAPADGDATQARYDAGSRIARALYAWLRADGTLPGHVLARYAGAADAYEGATAAADAWLAAALAEIPPLDLSATPWAQQMALYVDGGLLRVLAHVCPPAALPDETPEGADRDAFMLQTWLRQTEPLRADRLTPRLQPYGLAYGDAHPAIRAWGMTRPADEPLPDWAAAWCRAHVATRLRAMPAWVADHWPEAAGATVPSYINDFLVERLVALHAVCRYYTMRAFLDELLAVNAEAFVEGRTGYEAHLNNVIGLTNETIRLLEATVAALAAPCFAPGRAHEYVVRHGCMTNAREVPDPARDAAETGFEGPYVHVEVTLELRKVSGAVCDVLTAWLKARAPDAHAAAERAIEAAEAAGPAHPCLPPPRLVVLQAYLFVATLEAGPDVLEELIAAATPRLQLELPSEAARQYKLEAARRHVAALEEPSAHRRPDADLDSVMKQRRRKRRR